MRYQKLDALRGIALIGMVLFHTHYLLENIFDTVVFYFSDTFWFALGRTVAILFILVSGISFFLSAEKNTSSQIVWKGIKRFLILVTIAVLISMVTYMFFHEQRISFGIIHFFALVSILGLFFTRLGIWNILIGIAIIVIGNYMQIFPLDTFFLVPFGLYPPEYYSADYYPVIPWFGYYLIGFGISHWLRGNVLFDRIFLGTIFGDTVFAFLGKHTLFFYIIHVPIIYIIAKIFLSGI